MNKNLYITQEDAEYWDRAKRLFPFYLDKSVSQFCIDAIREKVKELEQTAQGKPGEEIMMTFEPAGATKEGRTYEAFWRCPKKIIGHMAVKHAEWLGKMERKAE